MDVRIENLHNHHIRWRLAMFQKKYWYIQTSLLEVWELVSSFIQSVSAVHLKPKDWNHRGLRVPCIRFWVFEEMVWCPYHFQLFTFFLRNMILQSWALPQNASPLVPSWLYWNRLTRAPFPSIRCSYRHLLRIVYIVTWVPLDSQSKRWDLI
jgi:hypothetical protein